MGEKQESGRHEICEAGIHRRSKIKNLLESSEGKRQDGSCTWGLQGMPQAVGPTAGAMLWARYGKAGGMWRGQELKVERTETGYRGAGERGLRERVRDHCSGPWDSDSRKTKSQEIAGVRERSGEQGAILRLWPHPPAASSSLARYQQLQLGGHGSQRSFSAVHLGQLWGVCAMLLLPTTGCGIRLPCWGMLALDHSALPPENLISIRVLWFCLGSSPGEATKVLWGVAAPF